MNSFEDKIILMRNFLLQLLMILFATSCTPLIQELARQSIGAPDAGEAAETPNVVKQRIEFETDEGTWLTVDVSPDGTTVIFDLLGDIYRLPISGGDAVALTTGPAWDQAPRFSPDGKHIYFVSDREGAKNIWRIAVGERTPTQVTMSESDLRGTLNWSRSRNRLLIGREDPKGNDVEVFLHAVNPATGSLIPISKPAEPWSWTNRSVRRPETSPIQIYSAVELTDGTIYYSRSEFDRNVLRGAARLYKFDREMLAQSAITPLGAVFSEYTPQLSHSGEVLAYFRQYPDRRTEIRIRNLTTGEDKALVELDDAGDAYFISDEDSRPNYAFTPDDKHLVFWHNGKIHRVALADGARNIISFRAHVVLDVPRRVEPTVQSITPTGEAQVIRWPSLPLDGETLIFTAIGYIWIMDMDTGAMRRLTRGDDFEYMPALSPNGQQIAYISVAQMDDGYGPVRLMVADIYGGASREVLVINDGAYLLPAWSPDGKKIALVRAAGLHSVFGWTHIGTGTFNAVAMAPQSGATTTTFFYTRAIGFNAAGDELVYGYATSRTGAELAAAALDGSNSRTLAVATGTRKITPSPDLRHLALTDLAGRVWTVPFQTAEMPVAVTPKSQRAQRVSDDVGGYYVNWSADNRITYGFGRNVYDFALDADAPKSRRISVFFDRPAAQQPIALVGARLITVSGDKGAELVIEDGAIVVDGQRIVGVGPTDSMPIPENASIIDATGKTIMPGLIDTHYHRIGGSGQSAYRLPNPRFGDVTAIAYGVTTAWEPGGVASDGAPAVADLQAAGRILGPRWTHSAVGGVGRPYSELTSYGAARTAVARHQQLGVHTLKEYNAPTRQQRQWLAAAAREKGLGIVSHLENFDGMMTRIVDGYTGGDHPHMPAPFFKDIQELLRRTGYIWTPNLVITAGSIGVAADKHRYYWHSLREHAPEELDKYKAITSFDPHLSLADTTTPYTNHRISRMAQTTADAARAGASIGVSAHNMPGALLHAEMWHLWKGGMPTEDVLHATTMGNAKKIGLQNEIGSLEVGKIADFLILEDNPLDDILNTLSIEYTVQGGVFYDADTAERIKPEDLQQWLGAEQAANDDDATESKTANIPDSAVGRNAYSN